MSTNSNIRANRITAQTITSNFLQGSNADITNITCGNETVNNLTVTNNINLNGDIDINGNLGITGYVNIYNTLDTNCSGTTGALTVAGGVAIQKQLFVGGTGCIEGDLHLGGSGYIQGNLGVTGTINSAYLQFDNLNNNYTTNNVKLNLSGTTGNISYGYNNMENNLGNNNIAIGDNCLIGNTGNNNIAIGHYCLSGNTGNNNIAIGDNCLSGNTGNMGNFNKAFGHNALSLNSGSYNCAMGYNSVQYNENGSYNSAFGYRTIDNCSNGNGISAFGYMAGTNLITGNNITCIGANTLAYINGGQNIIGIGDFSGPTGSSNITGCVCIGSSAGNYTTNSYNTFVGYQAGWTGPTTSYNGGTGNICIGAYSYPTSNTMSNYVVLGDVQGDNFTTYDLTQKSGYTWSGPSDVRDKTDIESIPFGIDLINKIQPSRYKWDKRLWYENGQPDGSKKQENWTPGFIAQQLDQVQNENQAEYLNMVDKNDPEHLRITTGNLIPVIVKALQELSKENEELKARITVLENKNNS